MKLEEALTIAIEHEHRVRDHYRRGVEEILDPQGKRVFETLAREEQGHVDYLESRLAELTHRGVISAPEVATVLPSPDFVSQARASIQKGPEPTVAVQSELDLLRVALDLEHATSSFYRRMADSLTPEYQPMFARFLEIEQGHLAIVQAEIDSLAGNGNWFDFMEVDLEMG